MYTRFNTQDLGASVYTDADDELALPTYAHVSVHDAENLHLRSALPPVSVLKSGGYAVSAATKGFSELTLFTKDPMALVSTLREMADALEAQFLWTEHGIDVAPEEVA